MERNAQIWKALLALGPSTEIPRHMRKPYPVQTEQLLEAIREACGSMSSIPIGSKRVFKTKRNPDDTIRYKQAPRL